MKSVEPGADKRWPMASFWDLGCFITLRAQGESLGKMLNTSEVGDIPEVLSFMKLLIAVAYSRKIIGCTLVNMTSKV